MKKVAVIIKHPFRDNDWRVDIYEVDKNKTNAEVKAMAESKMLGPFRVVAITEKIG